MKTTSERIDLFSGHLKRQGECLVFTGCRNFRGYGLFFDGQRLVPAHRFAYGIAYGPIPHGLIVHHRCNNPACCRPIHLEATTQRQNVLYGVGPSAQNAKMKLCKFGHEFDYVDRAGRRRCSKCKYWLQVAYRRKKREERVRGAA